VRAKIGNRKIPTPLLPLVGITAIVAGGCGASNQNQEAMQEAAIFAGVAAVSQVVATASAQAPESEGPRHAAEPRCCSVCRSDQFACGDVCVPISTQCSRPKGCACSVFRGEDGESSASLPPAGGTDYILELIEEASKKANVTPRAAPDLTITAD